MKTSNQTKLNAEHLELLSVAQTPPKNLWETYKTINRPAHKIVIPLSTHADYKNSNPSFETPVLVKERLIEFVQLHNYRVSGVKTLYGFCKGIVEDLMKIMTAEEKQQVKKFDDLPAKDIEPHNSDATFYIPKNKK